MMPCKDCVLFARCNAVLKENLDPYDEPTDLNITMAFACSLMRTCPLIIDHIDKLFYADQEAKKLKEITATELRKVYDFTPRRKKDPLC